MEVVECAHRRVSRPTVQRGCHVALVFDDEGSACLAPAADGLAVVDEVLHLRLLDTAVGELGLASRRSSGPTWRRRHWHSPTSAWQGMPSVLTVAWVQSRVLRPTREACVSGSIGGGRGGRGSEDLTLLSACAPGLGVKPCCHERIVPPPLRGMGATSGSTSPTCTDSVTSNSASASSALGSTRPFVRHVGRDALVGPLAAAQATRRQHRRLARALAEGLIFREHLHCGHLGVSVVVCVGGGANLRNCGMVAPANGRRRRAS